MVTERDARPVLTAAKPWVNRLLLALLCAIPFFGILAATAKGPGLSPDSIYFLSTGLNLSQGKGLLTYSLEELTKFPPGLPLLIAGGSVLGVGSDWTIRIVNILSLIAIVIMTSVLLRRHVSSSLVRFFGTAAVASSAVLLSLADMAWSEPIFVAIALWFLLLLEDAIAQPNRIDLLCGAVGLVWIGFFVRYAGLSLIPIGALVFLAAGWRSERGRAFTRSMLFSVGAAVAPMIWLMRNRAVDGTLFGSRPPSHDSPLTSFRRTLATVGEWAIPLPRTYLAEVPQYLFIAMGTVILSVVALALWRLAPAVAGRENRRSLLPLVIFTSVYMVFLVISVSITNVDPVGSRLLSVVYVPLLATVCIALDRSLSKAGPKSQQAIVVGLALILTLQLVSFFSVARQDSAGVGFAAPKWRNSELARLVSDLPDKAVIYSEQPDGIWAQTHRAPIFLSPNLKDGPSEAFMRDVACKETFLAWFSDHWRTYLMDPSALEDHAKLATSAKAKDGVLYRVTPLTVGEDCPSR